MGAPTFWAGREGLSGPRFCSVVILSSPQKQRGWWASPSSPDLDEFRGVGAVEVETATTVGQSTVAVTHVLRTQPHVAVSACRHCGVPAPPRVAPGFDPSLDVVDGIDTHHPRAGSRPRSGPGKDRVPSPPGPAGHSVRKTEGHHIPSCRGGERVLPLDGPSALLPRPGGGNPHRPFPSPAAPGTAPSLTG